MKRTFKSLFAVVLILTLILSGTMTAFAAENDGIKVQYNGEEISFAGAVAKNTNGSIMVPFRQVFEAMGVDVAYDGKTKTITAKTTEKEFSFTIGSTEVAVSENGTESTQTMSVAPFIDKQSSSAYVPVRFIAESMGYFVGWDSLDKTVVIIDPATIFANADEDFSVVKKLMKSELDLEKPYATSGNFNMEVSTYENPDSYMPPVNFTVGGSISGIQQKSSADLTMGLVFHFEKMLANLSEEEKTQIEPLLNMFKNANMKIKMDGDSGDMYMNSDLFAAMDPTVDKNTWYKMNMYDTYDQMGIDLKSIYGTVYSGLDLSDLLEEYVSQMQYADSATYENMKIGYAFLKNLIGDEAFHKTTSGSYVTYTLNINKTSLMAAMTKTALSEGISEETLDLTEIKDMLDSADFSGDLTIKEKNGSLSEYEIYGACTTDEMAFKFDLAGDQKDVEANVTIDMTDVLKMVMDVESHISESSKAPDLSLPEDAVIVDYPVYPAY